GRGAARLLPRAAGALQSAGARGVPIRAAEDDGRQGATPRVNGQYEKHGLRRRLFQQIDQQASARERARLLEQLFAIERIDLDTLRNAIDERFVGATLWNGTHADPTAQPGQQRLQLLAFPLQS